MENNKNLFSDFEVEGSANSNNTNIPEDSKTDTENENTVMDSTTSDISIPMPKNENVNELSIPITGIKLVVDSLDGFDSEIKPLLDKASKVISIASDEDNNNARVLGKELAELKTKIDNEKKSKNRPLKKQIEDNTEKAKKIIEPIEKQVDRIKILITNYELEKEKKRKEELAKIEKEKKEREEKERLDRERVSKIRNEIQKLREHSAKSINEAKTIAELNKSQSNLSNWKPKQEFFMEFYDEVNITLKNEIQALIDGRMPIVKELDEQREKAAKLALENKEAAEKEQKLIEEKLQADKKQKEQEEENKRLQEESLEMSSKNELIILISSFGVKDFEGYIGNLIQKYGNCRTAVNYRDQIIDSYNKEQEQKKQVADLDSQKLKNQRVDFPFIVHDESLVPREFLCVDEQKIKKFIQENRSILEKDINLLKINGVTITSKTQTVLKKS